MVETIIYYRKSTDRDDKQANSLEHQLNNCRNTAGRFWLEIMHELGESRSAKTEFTREKFNEMIKLCKTGKMDYIIVDEPKRLSRNNIDTSRVIDLMDKGLIKWVLTTYREYYTEHSRDKFFLHFDLALSKMDNEDRSKDVKAKMITCLKKWQWVNPAPDGYKNVTLSKGHKTIEVDSEKAHYIKRIFELRCKGYSIPKICDMMYEEWFRSKSWKVITFEQMKRKLQNKFYIWIMVWDGDEYEWKHTPIIKKSVFYKANNVTPKRMYSYRHRPHKLAGLLQTTDGYNMRGNTTKGYNYYMHWNLASYKINISEKKVLEQAHKIFKWAEFPKPVQKVTLKMLENIFSRVQKVKDLDKQEAKENIKTLKERKSKLVDSFLDGDIEKNLYKEKLTQIEIEIAEYEEKLQKNTNVSKEKLKKIQSEAELLFSLYDRESELDITDRLHLLKTLEAELFITPKKELPVAGMRIPSPNH